MYAFLKTSFKHVFSIRNAESTLFFRKNNP